MSEKVKEKLEIRSTSTKKQSTDKTASIAVKTKADLPMQVLTNAKTQKQSRTSGIQPIQRGKSKYFVKCCICGNLGHDSFHCLFSKNLANRQMRHLSNTKVRQFWVKKGELNCYMVDVAYRSFIPNSWYFDSGCSRHMTGNRSYLTNYKSHEGGLVTFGNGAR